MRNIITFAETYRNRTFEEVPFCIIDGLILSQMSYYDYNGSTFEKNVFNKKICSFYREKADNTASIIIEGMMTAADDKELIGILMKGGRHGDLRACRYVEEFCVEDEKQFAAITFELGNGEYFIAFRGTDTSVVGWKEDFGLSFQEEIPAQRAALRYAVECMLRFPGRFYIGGHSKGGNLAVYAAMKLPKAMQKRIRTVYNFDGPGFLEEVYEKSNYENIKPRICKIIPRSSIVGMILEEHAEYEVVSSNAELYWQHSPYTWEIWENDFVYVDSEDSFSKLVKRSLDGWLEELKLEERKRIVNTVFEVIYDAGINTFYEMTEQRFEKIKALLNSAGNMEYEEKKRIHAVVKRLLSITAEELRRAAREESVVKFENTALQLEKRAMQIERFLQSIQRGERKGN